MTSLWLLPAAVALVGLAAAAVAAARSAEEARRLGAECRRLVALRPLLADVVAATAALAERASRPRRGGARFDPGERSPT